MELNTTETLVVAILVLGVGAFLNRKLAILTTYNIPSAVSGGLVCSALVAVIYWLSGLEITFAMDLRDALLLVFFSTIGLSAKFSQLAKGGKALAIMSVLAVIFLCLQNLVGLGVAKLFGADPFYGLMAGSISFAGGHGTSITWGQIAEERELAGATELGLVCATMGLITGGMIGGPIATQLIQRYRLADNLPAQSKAKKKKDSTDPEIPVTLNRMLGSILLLAICVGAGDIVNEFVSKRGYTIPGFLTAMSVGVVLTNALDLFGGQYNKKTVSLLGDVSLQLFLSMSLMSMQIATVLQVGFPIAVITLAQVALMTVFAVFVVFRAMGRDYDACVISIGYVGQGLGATPVGIANMHALTERYGPSTKAFLVIPLIGAFFVDIANAMIIQGFLATPLF